MLNITLGKPRERIVAVADIGSGSAAVGIFSIPSTGPAKALAFSRKVLPFEDRKPDQIIKALGPALSEAGEKARSDYHAQYQSAVPPIALCYVIVHAPWTRSETTRSIVKMDHDEVITDSMITDVAHKGVDEKGALDHEHLIETRVIRVELNGYRTAQPVGKKAREISVATLMSDCNTEVLTMAHETLGKLFSVEPKIRSSTCTLLTVIPEIVREAKNYLIVDMTSEATAAIVVRDGLAAEHLLIPEGARSIIRKVAGKGMPEEVVSILRMIARDHCEGDACDVVRASLARIEPDLVRAFGEAMGKLAVGHRLPTDLVLAVGPDLSQWLLQFFGRIDFVQFTATGQPFAPVLLANEQLSRFVNWNNPAEGDLGLSVGVSLVNIEENASR